MRKEDFPIFEHHKSLVYMNSAATAQKPRIVIDALQEFYEKLNANIHRGSDALSLQSEELFEGIRGKISDFIHASSADEIVFTKNCTEAINLVAFGLPFKEGDKIVTTILEHHANMLPWMQLRKKGVIVEFLDIDSNGKIIIDEEKLRGAKLLAITSLSNALGNLQDIKKICETAHNYGVPVLVDAAQSISHISLDVQNLDCDFLAFSGHKMFSVNGVGVLYGKKELLDQLQPLLYGGDMIADVSLHDFILAEAPRRFEGGTQDAAAVYALGKAIDYLHEIGMEEVDRYVRELSGYAVEKLAGIEGIEIYGGKEKHGIISFNLHGLHCHDVAEFLASRGIAVRSGHLCCKPLMRKLGVEGVVRISLHIYNDKGDIDSLINALKECKEFFT